MVTIHIPPLRERREEIPVFLDFFLQKYSEFYGKNPPAFSDYAVGRMMEYNWPGNIRELENLVKRYVIVGKESQIIRELSTHKPVISSMTGTSPLWNPKGGDGAAVAPAPVVPFTQPMASVTVASTSEEEMPSLLEIGRRAAMQAEREAIERVLAQTRWNRRQAAKILKISYKALLNKLKIIEEQNQAAQSKQQSA